MATLKDHQQAMVDLLAHGSAIPASAMRLAHAMHDVLAVLNSGSAGSVAFNNISAELFGHKDATTPGLNDAALAGDLEAVRPKAKSAERRVKQLENTVKQLRANNAKLRKQIAENAEAVDLWNRWSATPPEQAGCRKDDTQVCDHDYDFYPDGITCLKCGHRK